MNALDRTRRSGTDDDVLPEPARRYLDHAIGSGAPLARAVTLRWSGEIKRKRWIRFVATETIVAGRRMVWEARAKILGLPARGLDATVRGFGQTEWTLFGFLPVAWARGAKVSRSEVGRMAANSVLLPSVLLDRAVRWKSEGPNETTFTLALFGHTTEVTLTLAPSGAVETIAYPRWGKPRGLPYGLYPYGGVVEAETTFGPFTIPSRLRMGWHFGTDRFERDGESYRATVETAEFSMV